MAERPALLTATPAQTTVRQQTDTPAAYFLIR